MERLLHRKLTAEEHKCLRLAEELLTESERRRVQNDAKPRAA